MQKKYLKPVTAVVMSFVAFTAVTMLSQFNIKEVKASTSRYELVWSDEFNGNKLNTNNWNCEIGNGGEYNGNPGWGNNEKQYYTDREENVRVSDGTLKITAIAEAYEGYSYTSARIQTAGKQSFQYGKLEARMKLPNIDGVWPAFWMLGYHDKGWPYCGEIDIMESWNKANFAQGAFHWFNELGTGQSYGNSYLYRQMNQYMRQFKGFDKAKWHTYAIEWNESEIKWLVDDIVYYTLDVSSKDKSESDGLYYFVLNLAVGGNLPYVEPTEGTLPATMEVDYVRSYQLTSSNSKYQGKWTEQSEVPTRKVKLSNGNSVISNDTVYEGDTVVVPKLTKKGYLFKGFYTKEGRKITSSTRIRSNVDAYAKWEKVKVNKAVITKVTGGKKKAKLKFKTASGAKGYQILYGTKKSLKDGKKTSIKGKTITIPKLKSGKKYYFKARAYKLDSKGKKVYGKWSRVKSAMIK